MKQKELLEIGLSVLGPNFSASICEVCKGAGEYDQIYTVGCGGGSYTSSGPCHWCRPKDMWYGAGTGLVVGRHPASSSILNQVIEAANKHNKEKLNATAFLASPLRRIK